MGKPITIGEDCWIGGNVIALPGVTIGKGVTIGAGSVVTKVCLLKPIALEAMRGLILMLVCKVIDFSRL